jgi:uncharacterized phiE125 gp8 family phage protein
VAIEMSRPVVVTPPASEPLTLAEAKRQVVIAADDDAHDHELIHIVQAAREQWEHDTDSVTTLRTLSVSVDRLGPRIELPKRPIQSIDCVKYYDSDDAIQDMEPGVYVFDAAGGAIRLAHNQQWPDVPRRWDAVTIKYVAGYSRRQDIPAIAKQAMLLLVGYYFENRGDHEQPRVMQAYESLVIRFMRSSYP